MLPNSGIMSPQDEGGMCHAETTIPILEYLRSDQLSDGVVWITTKSGVSQEGMLNQNIAFVFINGSGIYVRSIILKEPLGWSRACSNYVLLTLRS